MNKQYFERLKYLASNHLNCALDDNEPRYIPDDLKERTYRWTLYIYSNIYKIGDDTFDPNDRQMFLDMTEMFKKEHLISWTRDRLIELNKERVQDITDYLQDRIKNTVSFFELKVCLYCYREIEDKWFISDPFMIEMSPGLKEYAVNEKL